VPTDPLTNPFWYALHGPQRGYAAHGTHACRYHPIYATQCAVDEPTAPALRALYELLQPGESVDLFHTSALDLPGGLTRRIEVTLVQMVHHGAAPLAPHTLPPDTRVLGPDDARAMLELVKLTRPGPFRERTVELGTYVGTWHEGTLIAMAGQRANLDTHREISAVCTHPDHQRQGLAAALVTELLRRTRDEGKTPFLHVDARNAAAIRTYERLGFRVERQLNVSVLQRAH